MLNTHLRSFRLLILSLLAVSFVGCTTKPDPYRERVDALAAPYIDNGHIVGMSVGLIVDGEQYTYHYGTTHVGKDRLPDDQTRYEIGSISKTFTGLILARGTVEDYWHYEDPVTQYLPDDIDLPVAITLAHLSTHTSGLPRMPNDFAPADMTNPYADYDREKLYATLRSIEMESETGTRASYSNLAVGLLGDTMARERGMSYEAMLKELVLEPLGMRHTSTSMGKLEYAHLAGPHNLGGEPDHRWDFKALAGAGAIRSDIGDMLIYAQAQLDPGSTPIPDAIDLAQMRHTAPDGPSLGNGTGLGWVFMEGEGVLGHSGQTGGFHSFMAFDRPRQMSIVILTNTGNDYGSRFSSDLRKLLLGEEIQPADLPARPQSVPVATEILDRYVGQYQLAPEMVFTITRDGNMVYAQLTGQPTIRIYPTSDTEFAYRAVEARIVFAVDAEGNCKMLTLFQNGRAMEASRIVE